MVAGLIGKKLGMTQIFTEDGRVIPVTVIEAGPCYVIQKRTSEKDGYLALQLGFERKKKNIKKPEAGHFKKAGKGVFRFLKEFKVNDDVLSKYSEGDELKVDIFQPGEKVNVTGYTKGRGFQGVVKRWGFGGGPSAHGSKFHRRPGSIGQCVFPAKVWKGKKMPGHYGNEKRTVKNLEVIKVYPDKNLLLIKGAVPGHKGSIVYIKK